MTITNGGFETGDLTGWEDTSEPGGVAVVGATYKDTGDYGCLIDSGAGDWGEIRQTVDFTNVDMIFLRFNVISPPFSVKIHDEFNDFTENYTTNGWTGTYVKTTQYTGNKSLRLRTVGEGYGASAFVDNIETITFATHDHIYNGDFELGDMQGWYTYLRGSGTADYGVTDELSHEMVYCINFHIEGHSELGEYPKLYTCSDWFDLTGKSSVKLYIYTPTCTGLTYTSIYIKDESESTSDSVTISATNDIFEEYSIDVSELSGMGQVFIEVIAYIPE